MSTGRARARSAAGAAFPLALAFLAGLGPPAPAGEPERQVLFWIRSGELSPSEVEGDPEETPHLREMVLKGVTVAEISLPDADKLPSLDPAAIAAFLFGPPARARIQESRGSPVAVVGPETPDPSVAGRSAVWTHPVADLLGSRFGRPPPPGEEEEEAVRRIQAALGAEGGSRDPSAPSKEASPSRPASGAAAPEAALQTTKPDPRGIEIAKRSMSSLEDGAPLVIAIEPVQDPAGARERDAALGWLAAGLHGRDAFLMVLSVKGRTAGPGKEEAPSPRAALLVLGPGVRPGTVLGERRPLAAAAATALRLLGVPPPPGHDAEAIDAIER